MSLVRSVSFCGLLFVVGIGCRSSPARLTEGPTLPAAKPVAARSANAELPVIPTASDIRPVVLEEPEPSDGDPSAAVPLLESVEELSLGRLIEEVQAVHPSVQAMYAAWQAAQARYPQAVSLEDPMFGKTVAPASFGSRDVESAYVLEVSQKFPWHGKRALRGAAANAEANGAAWDVETTRQKLAEIAELAFWEYYVARRQLGLNEQNATILRSFRANAETRYQTGLVTQQDILQADIELANLEQRRIELERMDKVAAGRINVLIRRNPTSPLPPPQESLATEIQLPDQESLLTRAVYRRPDISAAAARVRAEQARLSLACKQYYPDVEVFGRYDTFWEPSDLRGQVGARVNLPIYFNRLNAAVSEAMHQVTKARAEYDQLVLEVQSEVQSAYEQVRESQRTVALYSQKLIPAAEQNVAVARSSYDVSKINFLDLAIAERQLIEAREKQLQAQVELQRRTATLRRLVGGSLLDDPAAVDQSKP